jgi:hypothetical protein
MRLRAGRAVSATEGRGDYRGYSGNLSANFCPNAICSVNRSPSTVSSLEKPLGLNMKVDTV